MGTKEDKEAAAKRLAERRKKRGVSKKSAVQQMIDNKVRIITLLAILMLILIVIFGCKNSVRHNITGLENLQPDWSNLVSEGMLKSYNDEDRNVTSQIGIDVSAHQGKIDWKKVASQGIDFTMVRIGYRGYKSGSLVLDKNFDTNISGAKSAGLSRGVYFYSQALTEEEAREEAEFVLENLKGIDITYPVVYDQESYTEAEARTDNLSGAQATANALEFCKTIEQAGYVPMIYMNSHWATDVYDMYQLSSYLVWYADYKENPLMENGFSMWQYTNEGVIDGIGSKYVDMNMIFVPKNAK